MNNNSNENKDSKKILTLIVLIATVMICTTGATYAYFAFSQVANNAMNGTAATASLEITAPELVAPAAASATKPLVPQKSLNGTTNVLTKAYTGASGKGNCIDANDNVICRVYKFSVKNNSTVTANVKGQFRFSWSTNTSQASFNNLRWKLVTLDASGNVTGVSYSTTDLGTYAKTGTTTATANSIYSESEGYTEWQPFAENVTLAASASQNFGVIFWIEETNNNQNDTDKGTFSTSIQFINNVDGSGITSTITS